MDNRDAVSAFLRSRRDRITPEQAGLASYGQRRVPGLRRGEVATLAGVSVEYYTRLERGDLKGVSDSVLDALARALRLDDTERMYLYDLARAAGPAPGARARQREVRPAVRPSVTRIVEGIPELPAYVMNNRLDVLAANPLGRALYSDMYADPACGANVARFAFLNPVARRFYTDWERMARFAVGALRVEAGRDSSDPELSNLIGELCTRSDAFRVLWGSHDVQAFRQTIKRLTHPLVGGLELDQEPMRLPDESGLSVVVYSAPPGTTTEDGLRLLASWSATIGQQDSESASPRHLGDRGGEAFLDGPSTG
ncbi:transcriptional regulator [Sphaerisporangium siamense]|uniref:Transcriptional regulator with XRE-family HTH domain n=1 Tax=Sphaerisporangium siamense TaxID=795645 RepID=A0A7W7DF01_9ACTN|nr:helix-turn-helix transcriptional regulator [Sphaerisporangium siamense]MBB4704526.1 transcriptional regulator with XRE-family HTH domain [Sphaerisporangium siamense]GII86138.1 transcriptional regulator [Sphaerisporangium siamense]